MESGSVILLIGCGHKPSAGNFLFWNAGAATLFSLSLSDQEPHLVQLAHRVKHRHLSLTLLVSH